VYPGNGAHELRGAQIYLAAEPGLTAEWLQLTLERHLGAMKGQPPMPDCAFDVENLRVEVCPLGPDFGSVSSLPMRRLARRFCAEHGFSSLELRS
jgi:hypothetical protein